MPDDNTVAPIDRVNITYKSKASDNEDVEIPFKLMVVGDFSFHEDARALEDRKPVAIDKSNFDAVMKDKKLALDIVVDDHLSGVKDGKIQAKLNIESLRDLEPDAIIEQVPEMRRRLELRQQIKEIKAGAINPKTLKTLRERIDAVLKDEETRKKMENLRDLNKSE